MLKGFFFPISKSDDETGNFSYLGMECPRRTRCFLKTNSLNYVLDVFLMVVCEINL